MPKPTKRNLTSAALLFAALGDPTRLMLVRQLSEGGPASITVLAERQDMTRQGVTKHLRVLAAAGIIDGSRQGREQVWTLNPKRLAEGRRHIDVIAAGWDEALERFKKLVEE
jgi:DNA-binding transcriptional ArsR family regulator